MHNLSNHEKNKPVFRDIIKHLSSIPENDKVIPNTEQLLQIGSHYKDVN